MAENDPFNFQVNMILEKLTFKNGQKLNFTIGGNHNKYGKDDIHKILVSDSEKGKFVAGTFNSKIQKSYNSERGSLAHNLNEIFEGYSVSFVQGGDISPFIPFSKDSEGGINSLFYSGSDDSNDEGEGDIFIDCGYTKFFFNMTEKGTMRYLQNIGGFIGSYERRQKNGYFGNNYREYRPKGLNFKLNPFKRYKYKKINFNIVYLVDATFSMDSSIKTVANYCIDISNILNKEETLYKFKFGAVFYRDPLDTKRNIEPDKNEYIPLTDNMKKFQPIVRGIEAKGGGDLPEDWASGYYLALNNMNWENGYKLIIHIADYGAHGKEYTLNDKYPGETINLDKLIIECINRNITIAPFPIKNPKGEINCLQSFNRIKKLFKEHGKEANFAPLQEFNQNNKDKTYFIGLVVDAVKKIA